MRICHITSIHYRYDSRIFYKQCKSIALSGNEIHLIVNDNMPDEVIDNVNIHSIGKPYKNYFERFFSVGSNRIFFNLCIALNADIYQIHDPELIPLGRRLIRSSKKVIYDIHEDYPEQILLKTWIPKFLRRFISFFFNIYQNQSIKFFSGILTVTPHLYSKFIKNNKSTLLVSNFPSLKDISEYSNFDINAPIVYVGSLTLIRGIFKICQATSLINQKLVLSGKFTSKGLHKRIRKLFKNVQYLGYLNRNEVFKLLSRSSIGLVTLLNTPNHYNSYPTKMFEYMAAGIPIIASDFPIFKEFIINENCGLCVNPLNIKEIAKNIMLLKNNPELAFKMGENGRNAIKNKFNWEIEFIKLLRFYEDFTPHKSSKV